MMRAKFLLMGSVLIGLSVASIQLAAPLGYFALPLVLALFCSGWWAYLRAAFPRATGEPEPEVGDTRMEGLASSRALLFGALMVAALFLPVWFWIIPLFLLHAAWRAQARPGDFIDNFSHELRLTWRFLTRSAANAAVFALACILCLGSVLATYGLLYFLG